MINEAPALSVTGLSSGYGEALIVRDASFDVRPGEILALLGKNGMGKTTLLKTLMGFLPVRGGGSIRLFGEVVSGLPPYRMARRAIGYTPQEQALFQDLTVEENLRLGLRDQRTFDTGLGRIAKAFAFIPERLGQRAGTLSGGEQKMLLVARSLMSAPRLMLIDEITEGLQPSVIERLAAVLKAQRDEFGTAILLVEQNVRFALSVAESYLLIKSGEIVDRGRVEDVGAQENIVQHLSV
jgi:ABC-type branched-subunit amino acid transport system ATPase component